MRFLGVDLGRRRVGLAISDPSGTLARPLSTLIVKTPDDALEQVAATVARVAAEDEGLATIVIGVPRSLDGTPTEATVEATAFIEALAGRTSIPVVGEDERLSSHEADSRLAVGERDWRKRKARLDAAAAAVILQDHLDRRHSG